MTTLATDKSRDYVPVGTDISDQPVIAADIIFEGSAAGDNGSGFARPLVAGDPFLGFNQVKVDNAVGSAGDKNARLRRFGQIVLPIGSLVAGDLGKPVFASDDNTFTLTQGSNSYIGRVVHFESAGVGLVAFDARKGGIIAELTDDSSGTASDTIAAIGATYDQDEVRDAIASVTAKVNALLRQAA